MHWRAHQRNEKAPPGLKPWWNLFDLLIDLRAWGPTDRLPEGARAEIEARLPQDNEEEVMLEIEIWPTKSKVKRIQWRRETEAKVTGDLGGRIIDRGSIGEEGLIYEALLVGLSSGAVRELLNNPAAPDGIALMEGIQFILPQTIAQSPPSDAEIIGEVGLDDPFDPDAPIRAALLDGTPAAAHPALDGGIVVEDVHDLVRLSQVSDRVHATSMASLVLRGDLEADGAPLVDARVVSVPVLIDGEDFLGQKTSCSPPDKLFVDIVHTALTRLLLGDDALAPEVFVVNLSIGVHNMQFAGRISALARLIDWWSAETGVLFVISAGNILDNVVLEGMTATEFEDANADTKREAIRNAMRSQGYGRGLLAPAEAMNGLTVGAISSDLSPTTPPTMHNIVRLEADDEMIPALSSAQGLGLFRSIKPDLLISGGAHEMRLSPAGDDAALSLVTQGSRTGLVVATPNSGGGSPSIRTRGTSGATALTTRGILQAAYELVREDGPYQGQELPREDLALLTRALAVNSASWPDEAYTLYDLERGLLPKGMHKRAKEAVARQFGYGALNLERMSSSPEFGATLVGLGTIKKDRGRIFDLPLPDALSGEKIPRSMRVTLTWFSPIDTARVRYRLASLEAIAADHIDGEDAEKDSDWGLSMKTNGLDAAAVKKGSVWSRRLKTKRATIPAFDEGTLLPIRVQCSDASGGGLSQDEDIRFAIAITLEVETEVQFDIHQEIREMITLKLRGGH